MWNKAESPETGLSCLKQVENEKAKEVVCSPRHSRNFQKLIRFYKELKEQKNQEKTDLKDPKATPDKKSTVGPIKSDSPSVKPESQSFEKGMEVGEARFPVGSGASPASGSLLTKHQKLTADQLEKMHNLFESKHAISI